MQKVTKDTIMEFANEEFKRGFYPRFELKEYVDASSFRLECNDVWGALVYAHLVNGVVEYAYKKGAFYDRGTINKNELLKVHDTRNDLWCVKETVSAVLTMLVELDEISCPIGKFTTIGGWGGAYEIVIDKKTLKFTIDGWSYGSKKGKHSDLDLPENLIVRKYHNQVSRYLTTIGFYPMTFKGKADWVDERNWSYSDSNVSVESEEGTIIVKRYGVTSKMAPETALKNARSKNGKSAG